MALVGTIVRKSIVVILSMAAIVSCSMLNNIVPLRFPVLMRKHHALRTCFLGVLFIGATTLPAGARQWQATNNAKY